jgi:hypothetical protein
LPRPEAGFEYVPEGALAVELDPGAKGSGVVDGESHASVDCGFIAGRGFRFDYAAKKMQQGWLLAAGSGEKRAHGNRRIR